MRLLRPATLPRLLTTLVTCASTVIPCSWDYPIWSKSKDSDTPLFRFVNHGVAGYIDRTGTIVIPAQFRGFGNGGGDFFEGLANVTARDGMSYYIDAAGKRVAPAHYIFSGEVFDGLAARWTGKNYGYVDRHGRMAIPAQFFMVREFRDHRAAVAVSGGNWGYIDRSGKFLIEPRFAWAENFFDGIARVIESGPCGHIGYGPCEYPLNPPDVVPRGSSQSPSAVPRCKYSFIDTTGRILFRSDFIDAKDFAQALAPVGDGRHWGYIDKTGTVRIPLRYDDAEPFSEGLARVRQGEKWGYINASGTFAIAPAFTAASDFSEGFAAVSDSSHGYHFIDRSGHQAISAVYTAASSFVKGLAHVRVGVDYNTAKWSYIDKTGRAVFTYSDQSR
jgi:hypothetical protein